MMDNIDLFDLEAAPMAASFKVIGVGKGAAGIIERVGAMGFDCVACVTADGKAEASVGEEDKLAIIVAPDSEEEACSIARCYHDAGVLTLGLLSNADPDCFDSVMPDAKPADCPAIIKSLLQPVLANGYICYDFNDLRTTLRDTGIFTVLRAEAHNVEGAVAGLRRSMADRSIDAGSFENLAIHLFVNPESHKRITVADISHLSDLISSMPESVNAIWSANFDNALPHDQIRLITVMAGTQPAAC